MTAIQPAPRTMASHQAECWVHVNVRLPRFGQYVLYRTDEYQALGCLERPGIWRLSDGEPEPNPVQAWQAIN